MDIRRVRQLRRRGLVDLKDGEREDIMMAWLIRTEVRDGFNDDAVREVRRLMQLPWFQLNLAEQMHVESLMWQEIEHRIELDTMPGRRNRPSLRSARRV